MPTIYSFKETLSFHYKRLYDEILAGLVRRPVLYIDETTANFRLESGYVWCITDGHSVYYFYRSSEKRVLSKQWQGEFCRCSIDVVGGKQCDGGVDHLERFRHHTGPSAKAGKPMTQPAVDPLNRHRFILADIMPPNRQERVVRRIIVCTVQRDAPGFQPLQQPVQRGGITTATFPVDEALARAIKSQPDPQLVLFF